MQKTLKFNEDFLDRIATYFRYHEIQDKLFLTFNDFVECVVTGRWEEFVEGKTKLFEKSNQTFEIGLLQCELLVDDELGYTIKKKYPYHSKFEYFGLDAQAREQAIFAFNQIKEATL